MLVIGDLHQPYTLRGYRKFCKSVYKEYGCTDVMFTGDIIDNHYTSFHDSDPDGHSAGLELEMAISNIGKWHKTFPNAKVCIGNHDRLPDRKAFKAGVSRIWIRDIGEVLDTPGWIYRESFIIDNVKYCHGEVRKAHTRASHDLISIVQGHWHTDSRIDYHDGETSRIWSMQVGCGFDHRFFAADYCKHGKSPSHNCGVVLDNGREPHLIPYYLPKT